jgi:collagen type I/II/III/V/XI/XXIV/XXVII alpha
MPRGTIMGMRMACFVSGTRIATVDGPRPVETLRPGDGVLTRWGGPRPIRWVGRRAVDPPYHPWPNRVRPIRIAQYALSPDVPACPVLLAPGQAICLDLADHDVSVIVPCGLLVNDRGIAQIDIGTVTYWAVELDTHDVIIAEGLFVESYLDCGKRDNFELNGGPLRLFADFAPPQTAVPWALSGCLPLVLNGPMLHSARRMVSSETPAELRAAALG